MVRERTRWKFGFLFCILLLNIFTKSLPIEKSVSRLPLIVTTDISFKNLEVPEEEIGTTEVNTDTTEESNEEETNPIENVVVNSTAEVAVTRNGTRNLTREQLRPGQEIRLYTVEITIDGGVFRGRAVLDVRLDMATREDPIVLHVEDLDINAVFVSVFTDANALSTEFDVDDGIIEITPDIVASSYIVIIEYTGNIRNDGNGIFMGDFNGHSYIGMNLYPTNARRVFPCVDQLTEFATVSFTFENVPFTHIISNSELEDNTLNQFRALQGPVHLWGMVAHNFSPLIIPVTNVLLYGRPGLNQDAQASVAIQNFFNLLNDWTEKPYFEIIFNQGGTLNIFALPDTNVEWYALSTLCIWEPYILMESINAVQHRKTALVEIGKALSRQWFGYVVFPQNWRFQWVVTGLGTYATYELLKEFAHDPEGTDTYLLDMNTIFVTDVIQESLLRDGYATAQPLQGTELIFEEGPTREEINGLLNYKAPALLRMIRLILGNENVDYVKLAAQAVLNRWSLEPITSSDLIDALNSVWINEPIKMIDEIDEFMEPWVENRGYPLIHVYLRQGGLMVTQEHFGFTPVSTPAQHSYMIPLTYTSSIDMDFTNIYPIVMMDNTITIQMALDEEDFALFNIQGQGYYRVDYDFELWERIIWALEDPEQRNRIHPLNRATLIDDALNLARSGKLDYDIAFQVVLTWEHETEYAPWKAFVRNMNFLRNRLVAFVSEDEDLDQDIYLRMVRRTIGTFENEVGFYPDPTVVEPAMVALTRGLVMDHACRANYQPCIAAAIDWFYDPNSNEPVVNPDIPKDIRPAVYCTMVREGDAQVINALYERLAIEPSHYERVVILESLACSRDSSFINTLLLETIADNNPYGVEERSKIFAAVVESSYENCQAAINFISMRTIEVRNMYGGAQKLEELIWIIADNVGNADVTFDFSVWVNSINSNLDDSIDLAERARDQADENVRWDQTLLDYVYEWIDENDAPKFTISLVLVCVTLFITVFNH